MRISRLQVVSNHELRYGMTFVFASAGTTGGWIPAFAGMTGGWIPAFAGMTGGWIPAFAGVTGGWIPAFAGMTIWVMQYMLYIP
jgi:hypothetical protein